MCTMRGGYLLFLFFLASIFGSESIFAQACSLDDLRTGGQPGDQYVGPTCNNDGTYRSCYYGTGANHPADGSQYALEIDSVSTTVAFDAQIDSGTSVLCATGLPSGVGLVDVEATLEPGCSRLEVDLYTAPECEDMTVCTVDTIRLGGQPGDQYVGPTCNNDGTYRTCFYAEGMNHPDTDAEYVLELDSTPTGIAFSARPDSSTTVICATGLTPTGGLIDVLINVAASCGNVAEDLYEGISCSPPAEITACKFDTGGNPLSGWTMNATGPDSASGQTGVDGCVTLQVDVAGQYTISETEQAGWTLVSPADNAYAQAVESGESYGPFNFENFEHGTVTACKEGVLGNRLAGWTINLHDSTGSEIADGVTSEENGCVEFTITEPGQYSLTEDLQENWYLVEPESGSFAFTATSGYQATYVFVNAFVNPVPANARWALMALLTILLGAGFLVIRRRQPAQA